MDTRNLTVAILAYRKNRINHRLLFGDPVLRVRRGWQRELAVFGPGQTFGYERWRGNHYGTQDWRIAVCQTCAYGSATKVPGIIPGVILLLDARGRPRAKRALELLETLRTEDDPALQNIHDFHWREHANAIATGAVFTHERTDP